MATSGHAYPSVGRSNRNKPRKARAVKQKNMDTPARRGANDVQNGVQGVCVSVYMWGIGGGGPTAATHMLRRGVRNVF